MTELKEGDRVTYTNADGEKVNGTVIWFNPQGRGFGVREDGVTYPRTPAHGREDYCHLSRLISVNN